MLAEVEGGEASGRPERCLSTAGAKREKRRLIRTREGFGSAKGVPKQYQSRTKKRKLTHAREGFE